MYTEKKKRYAYKKRMYWLLFYFISLRVNKPLRFHSQLTNSKLKNKKFLFELLTQWFNFYFSIFELLIWTWKILNYTLSC